VKFFKIFILIPPVARSVVAFDEGVTINSGGSGRVINSDSAPKERRPSSLAADAYHR
jgi:hypothetical protein